MGEMPGISGLKVQLKAAAIDRWVGTSGWDLKVKAPRAAKKAVAAGAVYWFEIIDDAPKDWAPKLWLQSICDGEQNRRDGWGLALIGLWHNEEEKGIPIDQ